MLGSLFHLPPLSSIPPVRPLTVWIATELFGFPMPLVSFSGSGDKPFDWALSTCLLAIAAIGTLLWSLLGRAQPGYPRLHAWTHLFVRLAVGATMISYGMFKVIPLQMPFPNLMRFTGSLQALASRTAASQTPLFGIWEITAMSIGDQVRAPLTTDHERWRRVVVSSANSVSFQKMDDTFEIYRATIDTVARSLSLSEFSSGRPGQHAGASVGQLSFEQPSADRLVLDGRVENKRIHLTLQHIDHTTFRLLRSRFRWVQDYPENR